MRVEQTLDVLSVLARDAGLPFTQTALHLAQGISQGYPYLIQVLGFAAWDVAHEGAPRQSASPARRVAPCVVVAGSRVRQSGRMRAAWMFGPVVLCS
ncbi:hypothetical protein GCM10011612_15210 [Actinomyces gaoshouyii]|uniref:Uncharacterized protein n=1 Tax=Actinomyces gaoshouyii TaxID=1960083 RepID=A0A8H9HBU3_9ACTO|nr:hypothetical protein GCM10011612_15210 [Actinomyces gaoshouyii]